MISDPLLDQTRRLLAGYKGTVWVAGGWAIDLAVGTISRPHQDVDIVVPVAEIERFAAHVGGPAHVRDELTGEVRPFREGAASNLRPGPDVLTFKALPFDNEVLPAKVEEGDWVFPRGSGRIRLPLSDVGFREPGGLLVQRPHVVLAHKSRDPRPQDHEDFRTVVDHIGSRERAWLAGCIAPRFPDHPWLPTLAS